MIEMIRVAFAGLVANKLRSGLTILGLTIGVGSVIVLIAVGTGSSDAVQKQIDALGSNVLLVQSAQGLGGARGAASSTSLTLADATALENNFQAPDLASVSPVVTANGVTLTYNGVTYSPTQFIGTTPSYKAARSYTTAEGSWFTNSQETNHGRVLVVGPTVVSSLFGAQDPVGDTVQVNGTSYQIVGVTASKGSNGTANQDDVAFAPLTAVRDTLTGYGPINQIVVQAKSTQQLSASQTEVAQILNQVAPPTPGSSSASNFNVINQGSILQTSASSSSVFTTLLGEVAAISLLVGGIGVMNIMLVSVTERTREIGIRKAVGARRSEHRQGHALLEHDATPVLSTMAATLALAACGSSSTSSSGTASNSASAIPGGGSSANRTAFVQCLKKHGLTVPPHAANHRRFTRPAGGPPPGFPRARGANSSARQAAFKVCGANGGHFGGSSTTTTP